VSDELPRSRAARAAAERALIRVVQHYGARPEFVLLGGLVPDLLCSTSGMVHSGTTDVDVQVNLEIAAGTVNAQRLERALLNAEFEPDAERVWRWRTNDGDKVAMIKFELLADLDDQPSAATVALVPSMSTNPVCRSEPSSREPKANHHCRAREPPAGDARLSVAQGLCPESARRTQLRGRLVSADVAAVSELFGERSRSGADHRTRPRWVRAGPFTTCRPRRRPGRG